MNTISTDEDRRQCDADEKQRRDAELLEVIDNRLRELGLLHDYMLRRLEPRTKESM